MNSRLLLYLFLLLGFVAAPLANLTGRRLWSRPSGLILLSATLAALGWLVYELDRSSYSPLSWFYCGIGIAVGIAICIRVFIRQKFRLALVLGAALVCATVALHFLVVPSARHWQRAYGSVRKGMSAEQVQTVVMREFAKSDDYHVVVDSSVVPTRSLGYLVFDLRPQDIKLQRGTIRVEFVDGRATQSWTSLGGTRISWWDIACGIVLCAICWRRLGCFAETGDTSERPGIVGIKRRIRRLRAQGYRWCSGGSDLLAKKALMHSAAGRIRQRAYFSHPIDRSEREKELVEEDERP